MIKRLVNALFAPVTPGIFLGAEKILELVRECLKKNICYVIIHYVGVANADTSGQAITYYHKVVKRWKADGYHLFLNHDGKVEQLEPIGTRVNGCRASGWTWYKPWSRTTSNEEWIGVKALHICFETVEGYQMSDTQKQVLIAFFKQLIQKNPSVLIGGHREYPDFQNYNNRQNTLCPGYSVSDWLVENGVSARNAFYEVWKP